VRVLASLEGQQCAIVQAFRTRGGLERWPNLGLIEVSPADLGEIADMAPSDFGRFAGHTVETYRTLRSLPQVVIAGVDGIAYGAGCAPVMAADLVFASSRARFAQPEINIGIVGGAALLPHALALAKPGPVRGVEAPTDEAAFHLQQDLAALAFGKSRDSGMLAAFPRCSRP